MSAYDLPTSLVVNGVDYAIRSDYRAILDIMGVMADYAQSNEDRALVSLNIFYKDYESLPPHDYDEAIERMIWFINGGMEQKSNEKKPKLMDWQQDFPVIVPSINRVCGSDVRAVEYMHWWTFLGYYQEIGDCMFAQIVSIRKKKLQGKKLDKADQKFYRENHDLIDLKRHKEDFDEEAEFGKWATV